MKTQPTIHKIFSSLVLALLYSTALTVHAGEVTYPDNSYNSGDSLSADSLNAKFNEIKSSINDNDINIEDIQTQPQSAAKSFQTTTSGLFPYSEGLIKTITVTTPDAGQVAFTMSGYTRHGHTNGTTSSFTLWATLGSTRYRVLTQNTPADYPSYDPTINTFSFTVSFPVDSAGTHNIDITGVSNVVADWGDCGSVVQGCPIVTLIYIPYNLP